MLEKEWKRRLKAQAPGVVELLRNLRVSRSERRPMESVFFEIFRKNVWTNEESISGPGSTLAQTATIREKLPSLIHSIGVTSMLDAPCGDFNWMKEVDLGISRYIGADIVPDLVERNQKAYGDSKKSFVQLDITSDDLPQVDLILCRDCLFHLSYNAVFAALENFKDSKSRYLLTTTFPTTSENINIPIGGWRPLNMEIAPFNLMPPLQLMDEMWLEENGDNSGKNLGLWKLDDLVVKRD